MYTNENCQMLQITALFFSKKAQAYATFGTAVSHGINVGVNGDNALLSPSPPPLPTVSLAQFTHLNDPSDIF